MPVGKLKGAVKTKARLTVGSKVVYKRNQPYHGFENSPTKEQRLTVSKITATFIELTETPNIRYHLDDFFQFFNEIRWDAEDENAQQ